MESSTTLKRMIEGNKISVPTYQRAYSWETPSASKDDRIRSQTDVFVSDLENHNNSKTETPYYFGHFLFEKNKDSDFYVIDGQQRLTTIVIFLSALFAKLKELKKLTEEEELLYKVMIKEGNKYTFSTVEYDNQLLKDYVINGVKEDKNGLDTESKKRIVNAFDFFNKILEDKDEDYLTKMLETISNATCTTHQIENESEAIQMFIFQNNRGKKPSNLEIIKAQFMFSIHLYADNTDKNELINELKNRFEEIYKTISSIERKINEDDVLIYTLRVYFNSLSENNAIDKINKKLSEPNAISFIHDFTRYLQKSFTNLETFFVDDDRNSMSIHSLTTLGGFAIAVPFVIKAYSFKLNIEEIAKICSALEVLILRRRLIGTRADLTSRINDVYQKFTSENKDIKPIIDRVNEIKNSPNENWWWAYWNNDKLKNSILGEIPHSIAKFLLWKYENSLRRTGPKGYKPIPYESISSPELEHIAPQTPTNKEPIAAGYCEYDDVFKKEYINCLGNYLFLSKKHNCSIGNKPFKEKRDTYTSLSHHREIQEMTQNDLVWDKEKISKRKQKIIDFIIETM